MDDELNKLIQSLPIEVEGKELLIKKFEEILKKNIILDFKFNRTLVDKAAITNILNASITEIEKQKEIIENSKNKLNQTLTEVHTQRNLIEQKNMELNKLLDDLRQTQQQLILSEKMASLGELTAGIAHEIQNPLNFVNNFSEVSGELLDEVLKNINQGKFEFVEQDIDEIKQNLIKIAHHGNRADSIVKGMLQHSRISTGAIELTDLNKLTDEYLKLAYHGFRSKDKSFNATLKTDYDETLDKINVVPQDIGRVLLNLISNAFYACTERSMKERKKTIKGKNSETTFIPTVSVTTINMEDNIEIRVMDNGNGIPKNDLEKIFQPFFTTKPSGKGTGLGLSLSYDIVKAHGGELKVKTKESEGCEFIIVLPRR